jgi:hypothetical protein
VTHHLRPTIELASRGVRLVRLVVACTALGAVGLACGTSSHARSNAPPATTDDAGATDAAASDDAASDDGGDASPSGDDAPASDGAVCLPRTCPDAKAQCGDSVDDGCGGSLFCGACGGANMVCASNQCTCQPIRCTDLGASCGTYPDGCGSTVSCGQCANAADAGASWCNAGICSDLPCQPITCPMDACGDLSDGCGGILHCSASDGGACTPPETCGGGGVANTCGCTPKNCAQAGAQCGMVSDGCGNTIDCGSDCPGQMKCGGGGAANRCG